MTSSNDSYQPPYLIDRLKAYFLDWVVLIILMIVIAQILEFSSQSLPRVRILSLLGLFALYEPLMLSIFGGTLGHFVVGLRVRRNNDYSKNLFILAAFIRLLVKFTLGWISFFTVSGNTQKKAIHDFASGSVVLKSVR